MSAMFDAIVKALPPSLRPFAKAVLPALGTLVAVGIQALSTAITGVSASLVAYLATNHNELVPEEEHDVPGADGLEAFAAGLSGSGGADLESAVDDEEDDDAAAPSANGNGSAETLLTNGPRHLS